MVARFDIIFGFTLLLVYIFYCSLHYNVDFEHIMCIAPGGGRTEVEAWSLE
jgi:hypothetical protein